MMLLGNDEKYGREMPTAALKPGESISAQKSSTASIDNDIAGLLANDKMYGRGNAVPTVAVKADNVETRSAVNIDNDIAGLLANDTMYDTGKVVPTAAVRSEKID